MFKTVIKQNYVNRDVSKDCLQVNKEKYIDDLLLLLRSDKSLRKRARLKKWQVALLTLVFGFKKQEVAPGSVVACSVPDFVRGIYAYAEQKPELNELIKKHGLYDDEKKDSDDRVAAQEAALYVIIETLTRFGNLSRLDDGILYYEDTLILYRDMLLVHQDNDSQAGYNSDEVNWLKDDFDRVIDKFVENNTEDYITVLSEEDFFNRFKEYAESTLLSESVPADIRVDENSKTMLIKLISSIEYFYNSLYKRNILKKVGCELVWFRTSGCVVLANRELSSLDQRLNLV